MDLEQRVSEVRRQRERLGHVCGARPLPESLKREALACYRELRAGGTSAERAATRLGLSALTLEGWGKRSRVAFAPVVVEGEAVAAAPSSMRVVVLGPRGLRIEGLDVAGLAELLQRLA